ncbi:RusA family crossover junction endodeoxyribonuclease [Absiella sp. AM54-8XD]|nr:MULTISPECIES: RusA family crossover junction endodeoxyribonuclease [Bacillota]RGB56265.1 RusA family crossover junction endodeoxyribonuclease [Absiella sp. AM22-9]RGB62028.1 RusA family crossover junction endodeoxyribonuclease [Absiella sp. AM10-20]RGB70441.1 RusA family crossover junction endodeoxyribonuclease [Absiella sp. AM09-45]RGB78916.1 RusA family crossover junction endodeoxyribonuclease [Absiella sp. AM09-50]RHT98209.1 RusA family crossover junction endodeoxyribonuclease [Absiella 
MKFTVLGIPVAKGRPKFAKRGNFVTSYTPQDTVNYENLVRLSYQQSCNELRVLQGEVSMKIDAFFPIPKSTSKKKHQLMAIGAIQHTKKPDADNVAKAICDALNKIAYVDDSQIVSLEVNKYYSDVPRAEITITEVKHE